MKMLKKLFLFLIIITILLIPLLFSKNITVYDEISFTDTSYIKELELNENKSKEKILFNMDFNVINKMELYVNTYNINDNSIYNLKLVDEDDKKTILCSDFTVNDINGRMVTFNFKTTKVNRNHLFSLSINRSTNFSENISFDIYDNSSDKNITPLNIYGGHTNSFWIRFIFIIEIIIVLFIKYLFYLIKSKKNVKNNPVVISFMLGMMLLLFLFSFKNIPYFVDETDYVTSGIYMTKGKILYNDYVTQHMPLLSFITYFISLVFKAQSIEQFRVAYYLIISIMFSLIFIRYYKKYGLLKIIMIPIIVFFSCSIIYHDFNKIIADSLQAFMMIILLLEFLWYLDDNKLYLKRCIIISLSVYSSILLIFISVYPIFIIFVMFIINEVYNIKNKKINFELSRYKNMLMTFIIPIILLLIYFLMTNSFKEFFYQSFIFNREVYPKYKVLIASNNFGKNIFSPFYLGIVNILKIIPSCIKKLSDSSFLLRFIIIIYFFIIIIKKILCRNWKYIFIFLFVCMFFIRDYQSFHTIPAWCIIITVIVLGYDVKFNKVINAISLFFAFYLLFNSLNIISVNNEKIYSKIPSFNANIALNNSKYSNSIFIDIYTEPDIYLLYKNKNYINRNIMLFPWYTEVYEEEMLDSIKNIHPEVIVYNPKISEYGMWGATNYAKKINKYIYNNYSKSCSDSVWILKEKTLKYCEMRQ